MDAICEIITNVWVIGVITTTIAGIAINCYYDRVAAKEAEREWEREQRRCRMGR